jgi:hypothetical protein
MHTPPDIGDGGQNRIRPKVDKSRCHKPRCGARYFREVGRTQLEMICPQARLSATGLAHLDLQAGI